MNERPTHDSVSTMRALRVQSLDGWDIALDDVDVPVSGPGELLVRSEAVGLCGSDVHACRGDAGYEWMRPPVTLGHETVGTVIGQHSDLDQDWVGLRVAMIAIQGCLDCNICAADRGNYCPNRTCLGLHSDGGLAEFFTIAAQRVVAIDRDLDLEIAALHEPVAIVLHALEALPDSLEGAQVGVTGPGTIGLLSALECRRRGANVTIYGRPDADEIRLNCAADLGLTVGRRVETTPADYWVEASGSEDGLNRAVRACANRARIAVPGLFGRLPEVQMNLLVRGGMSLHGSYGYRTEHFHRAADFIAEHQEKLTRMVTPYPLDQAERALRDTAAGQVIKALVIPEQTPGGMTITTKKHEKAGVL
ncbi:MAG: zinc-dependent alcohol dehydrogenase [Micrococcaceae bacterium]